MADNNGETPSRWEILARERNARVVLCHTPDTYTLLDLARAGDRGIRALRNRLLISLPAGDVIPLLERYNGTIIELHEVIKEICQKAGVEYRTPRSIDKMLKDALKGKEDPGDDDPEEGPENTLSH